MLLTGEVVERAVGDHVHALGVGAEALHELAAAAGGVGHDGVGAGGHQPRGPLAQPPRAAAQHVVGGEHARAPVASRNASSASRVSHW